MEGSGTKDLHIGKSYYLLRGIILALMQGKLKSIAGNNNLDTHHAVKSFEKNVMYALGHKLQTTTTRH